MDAWVWHTGLRQHKPDKPHVMRRHGRWYVIDRRKPFATLEADSVGWLAAYLQTEKAHTKALRAMADALTEQTARARRIQSGGTVARY